MSNIFRSLKVYNYRVWASGAIVSNVGTWMQRTAQDWLVLTQLTHNNATAVGIVMALQFGPQLLLLPLTGFAADHLDRRKLLLATQAAMGSLALALGILTVSGALEAERIMGVETGGCPHTAIREDASINLEAIDRMLEKFPNADVVFIESGGDNLAATFSPELSDLTIYVIDVAAGEKIPRKGGPGITKSDLFVINKTDLAPYVGADLGVMEADTRRMRTNAQGLKPFVMTNLKTQTGLQEVIDFIETRGMLR